MNQDTGVAIDVRDLVKSFDVPERDAGVRAAARSLVKRRTRRVTAVDGVSLRIDRGEIVGFLGPNGAGKTTTLKILSGLLHPTSGHVDVLGHEPRRRDRDYLRRIALIMGNRNQLQWDIPASDSFELNRSIYRIPRTDFDRTRRELVELLDIGDLMAKPVRTLSLGERMKVEIVGSLLHRPEVLFLDEPTIGLDVTMQARLRQFIADYNARFGATVMLTSHYMADVIALASRVIMIHRGVVLFDGPLAQLGARFATLRTIAVSLAEPADLGAYGEVIDDAGERVRLRVAKVDTARVTAQLLADHDVLDLTIEDPPIDEIVDQVYRSPDAPDAPAASGRSSR